LKSFALFTTGVPGDGRVKPGQDGQTVRGPKAMVVAAPTPQSI
jgi:hypothetical protein